MARNGSGVKKASESSVEIEFNLDGRRCRERIKCKPTPANLRKLTLFRAEIVDAIAAGQFDYAATFPNSKRLKSPDQPAAQTLSIWMDKLLDRKEPLVKASTYRQYRQNVAKLKPLFGHYLLTDIKRKHVREWCETLSCGNRRINELIRPLREALACAVDDEIITVNPLRDFEFKRLETPKIDHVDPLTTDEFVILLDSLSGSFKNYVQFAIWTGLRTSELVALEWGDIDFVRGVVSVQRALTQAAKTPEVTKTRSGTREVKLLQPAMAALAAQKQHSFLAGNRVFLNIDGKPYTGDYQIWIHWRRALLTAGIRYRNPYQTRHTFASIMLSAGENINWIAQQLGHTSVTITLKHYARFIPDSNEHYGQKAVEFFEKSVHKNRH